MCLFQFKHPFKVTFWEDVHTWGYSLKAKDHLEGREILGIKNRYVGVSCDEKAIGHPQGIGRDIKGNSLRRGRYQVAVTRCQIGLTNNSDGCHSVGGRLSSGIDHHPVMVVVRDIKIAVSIQGESKRVAAACGRRCQTQPSTHIRLHELKGCIASYQHRVCSREI